MNNHYKRTLLHKLDFVCILRCRVPYPFWILDQAPIPLFFITWSEKCPSTWFELSRMGCNTSRIVIVFFIVALLLAPIVVIIHRHKDDPANTEVGSRSRCRTSFVSQEGVDTLSALHNISTQIPAVLLATSWSSRYSGFETK